MARSISNPSAVSLKRSTILLKVADAFSLSCKISAAKSINKSVTLMSSLSRLPGAETITTLRSTSPITISFTFTSCSADATDEPPNFTTFIFSFHSNPILMYYELSYHKNEALYNRKRG